jgi:adenylosuccinate lyase
MYSLYAISPIDGRYAAKVSALSTYFSEYALMRYRAEVEVAYFLHLAEVGIFDLEPAHAQALKRRLDAFDEQDALSVKAKEKETNHDVKAVEYLVKAWIQEAGAGHLAEWVHFGLTSQDINNTAIPMMIRGAMEFELLPELVNLEQRLMQCAENWHDIPMLAHTHGQPASPTRLGKEIAVFVERLQVQLRPLLGWKYSGKFGGATGNFNAHVVALPEIDWKQFADDLLEQSFGLHRQQHTTQIEHYDGLAALFDNLQRVNCLLLDLCRDMWSYVSMNYFLQQTRTGEVGSSAMPHKVNPIDFENAEGNLGIANALLDHLARKLPISRLQRDLTDSTVLRNVGVPLAHMLLSIRSILNGMSKLQPNHQAIEDDLEDNWAVLAEAYQTILRAEGFVNPYEQLRDFTRGKGKLSKDDMHAFVRSLSLPASLEVRLLDLTPDTYTGI